MIERYERPLCEALGEALGSDIPIFIASRDGEFWELKEQWRDGRVAPARFVVLMEDLGFDADDRHCITIDAEGASSFASEATYLTIPFEYAANLMIFANTSEECLSIASSLADYFQQRPFIEVDLADCGLKNIALSARIQLDAIKINTAGPVNAAQLFPISRVTARLPSVVTSEFVPYCIQPQEYDVAVMSEGRKHELLAAALYCHQQANWRRVQISLKTYEYITNVAGKENNVTSDAIEQMRKAYARGDAIDKEAFCEELRPLVSLYPSLYSETMAGEQPDKIVQTIATHCLRYETAKNTLCDALGIPQSREGLRPPLQPRERLTVFYDAMSGLNSTLDDGFEAYTRFAEKHAQRTKRSHESFSEVMAAIQPTPQELDFPESEESQSAHCRSSESSSESCRPSAIGSLIRDVAVTVAGTAPLKKQLKKQTKLMEELNKKL